mmetsp:Transcript_15136/g.38975  ORF Transcript_15136/g.38975 Transcript_15136/m.38975 type:complete len:378 (-) Transcript_15136:92-1225(-)
MQLDDLAHVQLLVGAAALALALLAGVFLFAQVGGLRDLLHQRHALALHVLLEDPRHGVQPLGDAVEQAVHAGQVLRLVIAQQRRASAVLLLHQLRLVLGEQLRLHLLQQLLLAAVVQVVVHALLLQLQPPLRLEHVVGAAVLLHPHRRLALVELRGLAEQKLLKVRLVALHQPHANLLEDGQHVLQQRAVDLLAVALALHQLQHRVLGLLLDLIVHKVSEANEADVVQGVQGMPLHVVPVQVVEEARQPANHELVVVPALDELLQQVLVVVVAQRRQHLLVDVRREGVAVPRVQLLRVVMRRLLGAHVVDGGVQVHVLLHVELLLRLALQQPLELCDAPLHRLPSLLQLDWPAVVHGAVPGLQSPLCSGVQSTWQLG